MKENISAEEAKKRLVEGNRKYLEALTNPGDISPATRSYTDAHGQAPYAVILACSDSREIPEAIFCAGIGELFVIRVAGNVVGGHQLGSIEYAVEHLGCRLVVVLGHTHCGAVDAALNQNPGGHVRYLTNEIRAAIAEEKDPIAASRLNIERSVKKIRETPEISRLEKEGVRVMGAMYHLEDGRVEFLPN